MKLQHYLHERFAARTAHGYYLIIENYCRQVKQPDQAKYKDILGYLEQERSKGKKPGTLLSYIGAIKVYYDWLKETGIRKDHPCKHLVLKDRVDPQVHVQELFSSSELQQLFEQPPRAIRRQPSTVLRDKVILSLLIYQGLTTKNIVSLQLQDLNLEQATIYVKSETNLNARTLELHPKQIMLISKYLQEERTILNRSNTDKLILTRRYQAERGCSVDDVVKVYKPMFPDKTLSPLTIRQSVIANLLKAGKDIRAVQVFAGHRSPMTTERYQQTGIEELTAAIQKFHPLK